jgi:hypothetical protein
MTIQPNVAGATDFHSGFRPVDNRYLTIHECSGFESGSTKNSQVLRQLITDRTGVKVPASERLHAIWYGMVLELDMQ